MKQPLISFVIANQNGEAFIENCLNSIFREENKEYYEVIIVDDASKDKSKNCIASYVKKNMCVLISLNRHVGISKARNMGAKKARGQYIFFIDTDTDVDKGWLKEIPLFFKKHHQAGVVQAKLITKGTNKYDCAGEYMSPFGFLVERSDRRRDCGQFDKEVMIFSARGAAYIVRKNLFMKLGGFDEDYTFYLEDTDFSWRIWLAGYQVWFLPTVTVYHAFGTKEKGDESYKDRRVYFYGSRHTILTIIKNLGFARLLYIAPLQYFIWFILGSLFILRKNSKDGTEIYKGIISSFGLLRVTLAKRKEIQRIRKISDLQLFHLVGTSQDLTFYFNKARSYLSK